MMRAGGQSGRRGALRGAGGRLGGDEGTTLMLAVGMATVVLAFAVVMMQVVQVTTMKTRESADSTVAVAAAQAGIEDYIRRLTVSSGAYWKKGNDDVTNQALDTDPSTPQCDGPGVPVPGSNVESSRYCYRVVGGTANSAEQGYVQLEVTGFSGPGEDREVERTLSVNIRPRSYLDYMYFTDVEVLDEQFRDGLTTAQQEVCSKRYWGTDNRSGVSYCDAYSPRWFSGSTVDGPMHSNDTLWVQENPNFVGPMVTTASPVISGGQNWRGSGTPLGMRPTTIPVMPLPVDTVEIIKYTLPKTDTDENAYRPGCLYVGQTKFEFSGDTVTVDSPNTTDFAEGCPGSSGSSGPIPPLLYVKSTEGTCAEVSDLTISDEYTFDDGNSRAPDLNACHGTALVEGTVQGARVSVAAQDDLIITGDIHTPNTAEKDMVGLLANNQVWVRRQAAGSAVLATDRSPVTVNRIDAVIVSLRHSFTVENWGLQPHLGDLTVRGAIIQKYRGAVGVKSGTSTYGYSKDYQYDSRLQNMQPPFMPLPVATVWFVADTTDITGKAY